VDILKVIALLLDYPTQEVRENKDELIHAITYAVEIPPDHRTQLLNVVTEIYDGELMDAEVTYTGLFEQGRSLSMHIFEHVHGESRDRGQAMVDLMAEYSKHGFDIASRELPDYIPMFLEYLSQKEDLDAREWLANVSHILALLCARLQERSSVYAHLFESLLLIAGRSDTLNESREQVSSEQPDNTMEAIDKEWEETAVTFGVDEVASNPTPKYTDLSGAGAEAETQPLRWASTATAEKQALGGEV